MKAGERLRRWTTEDDAILARNAGKLNDRTIAAMIGRTKAATKNRRQALLGTAPASPKWSAAEIAVLREHYASAPAAVLRQLLPGRPAKTIHEKVHKLGLGLRRHKASASSMLPWSEAENEALRRLYPDSEVEVLAHHLPGRSEKAIMRRAAEMGLRRSAAFWEYFYKNKLGLSRFPPELQEVIRLHRKLKKAIHEYESHDQ